MSDYAKLINWLGSVNEESADYGVCQEAADAIEALQRKVAELEAQLADCAPYLKEDETPAQRIKREREDNTALIGLLAKEKAKFEELEAQLSAIRGAMSDMYVEVEIDEDNIPTNAIIPYSEWLAFKDTINQQEETK